MTGEPATITVALLLAALGLKLTDFVKYASSAWRNRDDKSARQDGVNGLATLGLTAVIGFLVAQFALKPSAWGDEITIGDEQLKDLSVLSTVLFGIVFSAVASTLYDFKKALDNADSAKKPKLVISKAQERQIAAIDTAQDVTDPDATPLLKRSDVEMVGG